MHGACRGSWDVGSMKNLVDALRDRAISFDVREIADYLLDDPRFPLWSGSSRANQHHYGTGGLIVHVSEVVDMCLMMQENRYPKVNRRVLFLAALMHDWGKLWDYEPFDRNDADKNIQKISQITFLSGWQGTTHKRHIHHISRSAIEWSKAVVLSGKCKDIEDEVSHAILSHHGQRQWGSPVAPNTHVAWLLHCCDIISARMNDCGKFDKIASRRESG